MNLTHRVLRTVAVAGVATVAPLLAAMPAHAGIDFLKTPAATTAEVPPGPNVVGPEYVADVPPGPTADIIGIL